MAIYVIEIPEEPTLQDLAEILRLMTMTVETGAGDEMVDRFVKNNPHMVKDITKEHARALELAGAVEDVAAVDANKVN